MNSKYSESEPAKHYCFHSVPLPCHKAPPVDPATLVAINRTPGPDGNIFTLHLIKNGDEIFFDISVKDQKIGRPCNAYIVLEDKIR